MAAKTKYTPERLRRFAQALELGATLQLACQYAGFSYRQYRHWMVDAEKALELGLESRYKALPDLVLEAEAKGALKMLSCIHKQAPNDWRAAAWRLERRHGYQKTDRYEVEHKFPEDEVSGILDRLRDGEG